MKKELAFRALNITLRSASLLGKFTLIFFLVKYLKPEDVGLYGLIAATITYGLYPLGLEFYLYNIREIIKSDDSQKSGLIKNQIALYLFTYTFILPLFLFIFLQNYCLGILLFGILHCKYWSI